MGLEVGVGSGRFAQPLGAKIGIDPSRNMLKLAKRRGIQVILATGENLPFKNLTFDFVQATLKEKISGMEKVEVVK